LKALVCIMAEGSYEGKGIDHPEIRKMFTKDYLLTSDWYKERLAVRQVNEIQLWGRHVQYLKSFLSKHSHAEEVSRLQIATQLKAAEERLVEVNSPKYLEYIFGCLGADPVFQKRAEAARELLGKKTKAVNA